MIYDDGSMLIDDGQGVTYALNPDGSAVSAYDANSGKFTGNAGQFAMDAREAAKLDAFVVKPAGDTREWWERVAQYGLTRAIDNQYGPPPTNKTSTAGTFAGQNGKTYTNPNDRARGVSQDDVGSWLPLIIAAGVAFMALA